MDREKYHDEALSRLETLTIPVVQGLGLTLWGIEYIPHGRKTLLRIFIDGEDGVTVDQCAMISRQLSPALEVEETLPGAFILEVSSPGLERIFFHPEQLQDYQGQTVHARLKEPMDGRKSFQGVLKRIQGDRIFLGEAGEDVTVQWEQIKKINLVHDFELKPA